MAGLDNGFQAVVPPEHVRRAHTLSGFVRATHAAGSPASSRSCSAGASQFAKVGPDASLAGPQVLVFLCAVVFADAGASPLRSRAPRGSTPSAAHDRHGAHRPLAEAAADREAPAPSSELDHLATDADLAALEAMGVRLTRVGGKILRYRRFVPARSTGPACRARASPLSCARPRRRSAARSRSSLGGSSSASPPPAARART
jgi:hypothetical protein